MRMRLNYPRLIAIAIMGALCLLPAKAYAGGAPGTCDQINYAVYTNVDDKPGVLISAESQAEVAPGQEIFVCFQLDFSVAQAKYCPGVNWRTWEGSWQATLQSGAGSGTDWECFTSEASEYDDGYEGITAHFTTTTDETYFYETSIVSQDDQNWGADQVEVWFSLEAPTTIGRYGLVYVRAENSTKPTIRADTITKEVDILIHTPGAPYVSTDDATNPVTDGATLNGEVTDIGSGSVTDRGFDWGLTDSYGTSWTETGTYGAETFAHAISGLAPGTIYHFMAKAQNASGWGYGDDMQLRTDGLPPDPYLLIVQGGPEKGSKTWYEWIVVNPTSSAKTCTEVRVKITDSTDPQWAIDLEGYPTSGWANDGGNGISCTIPVDDRTVSAYSAKHYRVRVSASVANSLKDTTWSATVAGESISDVTSVLDIADKGPWGGVFYNKPDDDETIAEQTEEVTYADGLYAYLDVDDDDDVLTVGTEYTFYVNVHEWLGQGNMNGTLTITIPWAFTGVALADYTDFEDATVSGGTGASDWTITATNTAAINNDVRHLSFKATTPTGYSTLTTWEIDTRFTGTGGKNGSPVRYICEACVLVQKAEAEVEVNAIFFGTNF